MLGSITTTGVYCGLKSAAITDAGIKENDSSPVPSTSIFKVYPNPTTGEFTLEMRNDQATNGIKVEGYGMHGEKAFSAYLNGEKQYPFSLSGFPAGIYIIRLIGGEKPETARIIKL